jgi:accessory colonization factor AcfC
MLTHTKEIKTIHIYGPGGPYKAMKECAEAFMRQQSIRVDIVKGTPDARIGQARQDADIVYGGAEYMLEDYNRDYPGLIEMSTVEPLYVRQIGIIVRKGNPKQIESLEGLSQKHIRVLNVELEKMEEYQDKLPGIRGNIYRSVVTGEEGIAVWQSIAELDAWITYRTWYIQLSETTDFIPLNDPFAYRATPIAFTVHPKRIDDASLFIRFLKSDDAHLIFKNWGWD